MNLIERIKTKPGYKVLVVAVLLTVGMTVDYRTEVRVHEQKTAEKPQPLPSHNRNLTAFFEQQGSPIPARMAGSVHGKPLLAAIAATESNGNPKARGKKGERGAFQVMPKYWGKVPRRPEHQARQADTILAELLRESGGDVREALGRYNGDRSGRYAERVLEKLVLIR